MVLSDSLQSRSLILTSTPLFKDWSERGRGRCGERVHPIPQPFVNSHHRPHYSFSASHTLSVTTPTSHWTLLISSIISVLSPTRLYTGKAHPLSYSLLLTHLFQWASCGVDATSCGVEAVGLPNQEDGTHAQILPSKVEWYIPKKKPIEFQEGG